MHVQRRGMELAINVIERAWLRLALSLTVVRIGLPRMMPSRGHGPHQAGNRGNRAAGHIEALALQLQLPARPCGPRRPGSSPPNTRRTSSFKAASRLSRADSREGIDALCDMGVIGRQGDRQHPARSAARPHARR